MASSALDAWCADYPSPSRTDDIKIVFIVTLAVAIPVVLVRCVARLQSTSKLCADDWTSLLAMVSTHSYWVESGEHYANGSNDR